MLVQLFFLVSKNVDISRFATCGSQNITILTLKTGLFKVCFTENRYKNITTSSINTSTNSTIPLWVRSITELRCLTRKFAIRWRVTTVQSLSSPPQIDIVLSVPNWVQNLLTIQNSRLFLSLRPFLLLLALLAGSFFLSNPETLSDGAHKQYN